MPKQVQNDFCFYNFSFIRMFPLYPDYLYLSKPHIMLNQGYIYIMSNKYRTTFYVGVTSALEARVWQHINGEGSDFVKRYKLFDLVYFEHFHQITEAIGREKQVKNWHRSWKVNLIKSMNPEMRDLKGDLDWEF